MKRLIFLAAAAGCVSSGVHAQGYVGAVLSLTRIGVDCQAAGGTDCDKTSKGGRFYAGTKLSPANTLNLGIGKIDAVEVSYMRFGSASISGGTRQVSYNDYANSGNVLVRTDSVTHTLKSDALSAALVANFPVVDQLSLAARLGFAYVSATYDTDLAGTSESSQSQSRIRPYVGFSVEYDIPSILKIVGSFDQTKYSLGNMSGNQRMFGLGVSRAF